MCVFSGAGISAESGIPTFRDAQTGLWAKYSPQELATPDAFAAHPNRVWQWYAARRSCAGREPNPGHQALVTLASRVAHCTLVTQNVDDLHERAGSRDVINRMGRSCAAGVAPGGARYRRCRRRAPAAALRLACGALMRPDVVWFGEAIPRQALLAGGCGRGRR